MLINLKRVDPTVLKKCDVIDYSLSLSKLKIGQNKNDDPYFHYDYTFETGMWHYGKFYAYLMVDMNLPGFPKTEMCFTGKTFWDNLKLYFRYLMSK